MNLNIDEYHKKFQELLTPVINTMIVNNRKSEKTQCDKGQITESFNKFIGCINIHCYAICDSLNNPYIRQSEVTVSFFTVHEKRRFTFDVDICIRPGEEFLNWSEIRELKCDL